MKLQIQVYKFARRYESVASLSLGWVWDFNSCKEDEMIRAVSFGSFTQRRLIGAMGFKEMGVMTVELFYHWGSWGGEGDSGWGVVGLGGG